MKESEDHQNKKFIRVFLKIILIFRDQNCIEKKKLEITLSESIHCPEAKSVFKKSILILRH